MTAVLEHLAQLSIHAYYAGERDVGHRSCERLLAMDVGSEMRHQTLRNLTWYAQPIEEMAGCRFVRFDVDPASTGWSLFNPTIIHHGGPLLAIVRSSNYRIVDGAYVMPDADAGVIRTENILCQLADDLTVQSARVIAGPQYEKTDYPVDGLEDCRLRQAASGVGVSATVRNIAPYDGRCRIATADLDVESATFSDLRVLALSVSQEHEKNWMPCGAGWVYGCSANGHIVTVDQDPDMAGGWQLRQREKSPPVATEFRGGSQLVPYAGGWLCVVHEVAHASQRVYLHRFVWFDNSMRLRRVSPAFCFRERMAIEFAAGIVVMGERVLVSFGVRDAEAWLVELTGVDVWRLLQPVSSPATSGLT
jgi:hypothetical protein